MTGAQHHAIKPLEHYTPSAAALEDYLTSYDGDRFVESMRYVRRYPADLPLLQELLPTIHVPVLIVGGKRDAVVPLGNGDYLRRLLPMSKLVVLDSGHFAWEDAADEYAALVTSWWTSGAAALVSNGPTPSNNGTVDSARRHLT